jgi:hypothetical protein
MNPRKRSANGTAAPNGPVPVLFLLVRPPDNVSIVRAIWFDAEYVIGVMRRLRKDASG